MSRVDLNLNRLFITNIDGISLDFAKKILPKSSRFNLDLYLHIFLHSKAQKNYASAEPIIVKREFSLKSMKTLVEGLRSSIKNQNIKKLGTEWINYTQEGTHKKEYVDFKTNLISKWLDELKPKSLWDIGANTGKYSRIASSKGIEVISFDIDPECVNSNYISVKKNREKITPLLLDILNPSPSIGWGCDERLSFYQRNNPDLVMSLALVHHLAISNNLPFDSIATQFARFSKLLIIEFVPKEDDKVQILLANREDVYHNYNPYEFEKAFAKTFCILEKIKSCANNRIFYLMKKK
jgi:ribosomal protein L11 methylase PrmA